MSNSLLAPSSRRSSAASSPTSRRRAAASPIDGRIRSCCALQLTGEFGNALRCDQHARGDLLRAVRALNHADLMLENVGLELVLIGRPDAGAGAAIDPLVCAHEVEKAL